MTEAVIEPLMSGSQARTLLVAWLPLKVARLRVIGRLLIQAGGLGYTGFGAHFRAEFRWRAMLFLGPLMLVCLIAVITSVCLSLMRIVTTIQGILYAVTTVVITLGWCLVLEVIYELFTLMIRTLRKWMNYMI